MTLVRRFNAQAEKLGGHPHAELSGYAVGWGTLALINAGLPQTA